jgi:hypothetical protein
MLFTSILAAIVIIALVVEPARKHLAFYPVFSSRFFANGTNVIALPGRVDLKFDTSHVLAVTAVKFFSHANATYESCGYFWQWRHCAYRRTQRKYDIPAVWREDDQ